MGRPSNVRKVTVAERTLIFKGQHDFAGQAMINQARRLIGQDALTRQATKKGTEKRLQTRNGQKRKRRARGSDVCAQKWKSDKNTLMEQRPLKIRSLSTTEFQVTFLNPPKTQDQLSPFYGQHSRFRTSSPEPTNSEIMDSDNGSLVTISQPGKEDGHRDVLQVHEDHYENLMELETVQVPKKIEQAIGSANESNSDTSIEISGNDDATNKAKSYCEVLPSITCKNSTETTHHESMVPNDDLCPSVSSPKKTDPMNDTSTLKECSETIKDLCQKGVPRIPNESERSSSPNCDHVIESLVKVVHELNDEITQYIAGISSGKGCSPTAKTPRIKIDSPKTPPARTNRYGLSCQDDLSPDCLHKGPYLESSRLDDSTSCEGDTDNADVGVKHDDGCDGFNDSEVPSESRHELSNSTRSVEESSVSFFDEDEQKIDPAGPLWRQNFLGQCMLLVEKRFSKAYDNTGLRPLCAQFATVFENTNEAEHLPISEMDNHQQIGTETNNEARMRLAFTQGESNRLIRNFINVATAFRMKFPYLLAGIQTGLESKEDLFTFGQFREEYRIFAKLCYGLNTRTVLECITHLRIVLESGLPTEDPLELEVLINRLFTGFGPNWLTIARLTGLDQTVIQDILVQTNNLNAVCLRRWSILHEHMLKEKRYVPRPSSRGPSSTIPWRPESSSLHTTMSCLLDNVRDHNTSNSYRDRGRCSVGSKKQLQLQENPILSNRSVRSERPSTICLKQDIKQLNFVDTPRADVSRSGPGSTVDIAKPSIELGRSQPMKRSPQSVAFGQGKQKDDSVSSGFQRRDTQIGKEVYPTPMSNLNRKASPAKKRKNITPTLVMPKSTTPGDSLATRSISRLKHLVENGGVRPIVSLPSRHEESVGLKRPMVLLDKKSHPDTPIPQIAVQALQQVRSPLARMNSPTERRAGKRSHQSANLDMDTPARGESMRKTRRISLSNAKSTGSYADKENTSENGVQSRVDRLGSSINTMVRG